MDQFINWLRDNAYLTKCESFSSFIDGKQQLLSKHFVRRILRQVNLVEAYYIE